MQVCCSFRHDSRPTQGRNSKILIDSALGLLSGNEVKPDPHPPIDIELNKDIELTKREEGENVG